jgi:hypothetical protein
VIVVSKARSKAILAFVFSCPVVALSILFYFKSSSQRRAIADPAIYAAQTSSSLPTLIGSPMQAGEPIRGTVLSKNGNGNADLQIPFSGAHGKGMLLEWAQQDHGQWRLCSLNFHSADGEELKILDAAKTHCEPE